MLAALGRIQPGALTAKRLRRCSLWTSQGWRSKRPGYAVEDPVMAEALGRERAVWCPEAKFRPLIGALRMSELTAEHVTASSHGPAPAGPDDTALVRAAVTHFREDLQRNAASLARYLDYSWDQMADLTAGCGPSRPSAAESLRTLDAQMTAIQGASQHCCLPMGEATPA